MKQYTIEVKQMSIICRDGKLKGARKFVRAPGLEFFIIGAPLHRRDICTNIAINKAIEHGLKAIDVQWWNYHK